MPKKNRHIKPRQVWADYDPHARRGNKWALYNTKAEQRANRPDLPAIRGVFTPVEPIKIEAAKKYLAAKEAELFVRRWVRSTLRQMKPGVM